MNFENMLSERSQAQKTMCDQEKMSPIGKLLETESRTVETA